MTDPLPPPGTALPETAEGTVVRSTGSWYDVQVGDRIVPSKVRGRFRLDDQGLTNPVAVGDRVTLRLNDDETGFITEIHARRSKLSRRAAGRRVGREHIIVANVDAVWTIQSIRLPKINPGFIDRVLVMAEADGLDAGLVFNKTDLQREADDEVVGYFEEMYAGLGYPVIRTSALTGEGIDAFRDALQGRTSVVAGPSGVGKSTLLNEVEPGLGLRTAAVSEKTRKGRHTTTNAALFALAAGGFVVDTPGIREFGVLEIAPAELSHYFVEFRPYLDECRFPNCTHDHEPGCAVQEAVQEALISDVRYASYLNILDSIRPGKRDQGR